MFSPFQIAYVLGVPESKLRRWLREEFPKKAPGKGNRWEISLAMARRMTSRMMMELPR